MNFRIVLHKRELNIEFNVLWIEICDFHYNSVESEDVLHRVREQSWKLIGGTIMREFVRNGVKRGSIVCQFASRRWAAPAQEMQSSALYYILNTMQHGCSAAESVQLWTKTRVHYDLKKYKFEKFIPTNFVQVYNFKENILFQN